METGTVLWPHRRTRDGNRVKEDGWVLLLSHGCPHGPAVPMPRCLLLHRYVLLSRPFCFEPSTPYEVTVRLQRAGVTQRHPSAFILIDSVSRVLLHPTLGAQQGWGVGQGWGPWACEVGMGLGMSMGLGTLMELGLALGM